MANRYEVGLAPTLGSLLLRKNAADGAPLAIANDGASRYDEEVTAAFGLSGLPVLELAHEEAKAIATSLGGRSVVGDEATESAFRRHAPTASIVHVATFESSMPSLANQVNES